MTRINHLESILKDTADKLKIHRKDLIKLLDNGGLADLIIVAQSIVEPPKPENTSTEGTIKVDLKNKSYFTFEDYFYTFFDGTKRTDKT